MKYRDISNYNIKTALKEIDEEEYLNTIIDITKKRNEVIKETNPFKRKKKLIDFLVRKGYETNLIYDTINELAN